MSKTKDYSLRITNRDLSPDFSSKIITFQEKYLKDISYIMSKEGSWSSVGCSTYLINPTEDFVFPHLHFYLKDISSPLYTRVRTWISNNIGKGNSYFAFKQLVNDENENFPIEYLAYILKTDVSPFIQNISQEIIDKAIVYDNNIKSQKRKKNIPLWKECVEELTQEGIGHYRLQDLKPKVLNLVMFKIETNQSLIRKHHIISTVQTILYHISPEYQKQFRESIISFDI